MIINVPEGVQSYPYKRRTNIFFVNPETGNAFSLDDNIRIEAKEAQEIKDKLDAIAIKRYWKFLGGRALTTVETLVFLAAGYGALRFIEYALGLMYG